MNEGMIKMLLKAAGFDAEAVKTQINNFVARVNSLQAQLDRIESLLKARDAVPLKFEEDRLQ